MISLLIGPEKSCAEKCKTDHPDELAEYTECYCKCEDTGKDCSGTNTFKGNLILTTATFMMIYQLIRWYAIEFKIILGHLLISATCKILGYGYKTTIWVIY